MTSPLATAYVAIVPTARGITGDLTRQLTPAASAAGGSAGEAAGKSFASRFTPSLGAIVKGSAIVAATATAAGSALAGFGIKGAASLEQTTVAFTSLLGSSKAATDQIKSLQQFAAATPFSQQDVLGYAQQYYAFADSVGLAKDQVQPFLTSVGDIAAVTGASTAAIHNAVMAIGQIGSSGKVTLDNLNQISEAFPGFNAAAAIASGTGQTTAQVMDEISKGSIDAKTGVQALVLGMQQFPGAAGAMAKQSQTLTGLFSTFKDTISITLTQAFQPLIPVVKKTLADLTPIIATTLQGLAPVIAQLTTTLAPVLGPLVAGLGEAITAVLQAIQPLLTALVPIIGPLTQAFVGLVRAVSPLIAFLGQVIATLGPPLLALFSQLVQAVTPVVEAFVSALAPVLPVIAQALQAVSAALAPVVAQFAGAFAAAMQQIAPLLPQLAAAFGQMAVALVPVASALVGAIAPVLPGLAQAFTTLFLALEPVVTALSGAFVQVINAIAPELPALADSVGQIAKAFAETLTAITPLIPLFTPLVTKLLPLLVDVLNAGAPLVVLFAEALTGLAKGIQIAIDAMQPLLIVIQKAYDEAVDLGIIGETIQGTGSIAADTQRKIAEGYYHLGDALGTVLGEIEQIGAQDLSGLINQLGSAAGAALGLANNLGAAGAATLGIAGNGLGAAGVVGATTAGPPKINLPKAPGATLPPFDASTLSGFLQTATGSQTNPLTSALNAIFASAKAAGKKLSDGLVKSLRGQNAELIGLTKQRDKIAEDLQKAQQKLADLRSEVSNVRATTLGTFDVTNVQTLYHEPLTVTTILRKLRDAVKNAARFKAILGKLSREGLAPALLQQLAEAGPAALDEARALAAATPKQIGQLNSQYKALGKLGGGIGNIAADQMFHGGVQAAQGLVDGLKSKESALNNAIRDLARSMVATLKSTLGIHSPSRVTRGIGQFMGSGLALGIADMHEKVAREGERLANSAVSTAQFGTGGGKFGAARGGDVFITQNNYHPMAVPTAPVNAQRMRAASAGLGR